jgi:hypothetical protein
MSYVYDVFHRPAGDSGTWTLGASGVTTATPGGRTTITGLTNGVRYEFEVRRTAPTVRNSNLGEGTPLGGINAPPDTFSPTGEPSVSGDGDSTAQRGTYNGEDGAFLRFTGGANWEYFEAYVGSTLVCRVEKSPKRVIIGGTTYSDLTNPAVTAVVVEVASNRAYFINTGGASSITIKPNGGSAIELNVV